MSPEIKSRTSNTSNPTKKPKVSGWIMLQSAANGIKRKRVIKFNKLKY
jgi:hypothetical protein